MKMTDREIINWLENNMAQYLIVPPDKECTSWSIYKNGHIFICSGNSLREIIIKTIEQESIK